jgi:hypothetical protein
VDAFKTGLEPGLICYQCVGTHPGCGLYNFDSRWYWGKICPRADDRCVKVSSNLRRVKFDLQKSWYWEKICPMADERRVKKQTTALSNHLI